jgi:ABC-type antimicrobial peptide transport system permease subunit
MSTSEAWRVARSSAERLAAPREGATRGLSGQGISFELPLAPLVAFTAIAALAGVLAAISPARRAAKLNVLEALKYE